MTPMFELLFGVDEELGSTVEEGSTKSDDVAVLWVPDTEAVVPEVPTSAPGATSGESRNRT